jgi:hypothetical protein
MLDRIRVMMEGRRGIVLLAALALVAVASASGSFSGASYVAVTTCSDTVGAGSLVMSEPAPGAVVLSADALRPGASRSATITLSADDAPSEGVALTVSDAGVTDEPGDPALSDALTLTLSDASDPAHPHTLWSGPARSLGTQALGRLHAGESLPLRVTLTFPLASARPELQGARTSLMLRFVEVSL